MEIARAAGAGLRWGGAILLLLGIGALAGAYFFGRKQLEILNTWPEVSAVVLNSEVTTHRDPDDSSTTYGARVEFAFTVKGRGYQAITDRGFSTSLHSAMERTVARFAPGTQHTIRYNPQDPTDARFNAAYTLEFFGVPVFLAVFGAIFLLAGVAVIRKKGSSYATAAAPGQCPTCGAACPAAEKFCPRCGTMLHEG
jgi:hypothetical protein